MKKKQIAQLGVTLGLVAAVGVGGTLAILTAQSNSVTNTFAAGNGINKAEDITLFETDQVFNDATDYGFSVENFGDQVTFRDGIGVSDWTGKPTTVSKIDIDGVKYDKLTPNAVVTKDPRVQISEGTADCYLFVKVVNGLSEISDITYDGVLSPEGSTQNWKKLGGTTDVWYYVNTQDANNPEFTEGSVIKTTNSMYVTEPLFNTITLGADANIYDNNLANKDITVKALAVQATKKDNGENIGTNWTDAVTIAQQFTWE